MDLRFRPRARTTKDVDLSIALVPGQAKADLIGIRFGLATRQAENTSRLGQTKRQIARILTILNERKAEA